MRLFANALPNVEYSLGYATRPISRKIGSRKRPSKTSRKLSLEWLENRLVLAAIWLVDNTDDAGVGSLRWALEQANASEEADVIRFDSAVFSTAQTIHVTTSTLVLSDRQNVTTIEGPGSSMLTVSGENSRRVFTIEPWALVELRDLTVANGRAAGYEPYNPYSGGGVLNMGNLTLDQVTLLGNSAYYGCGLFNGESGTGSSPMATVRNSTFAENPALLGSGQGLGISNFGGTLIVENSRFVNNMGGYEGGGVYNTAGGHAIISDSAFTGNSVTYDGGAVVNSGGTMTISGSSFVNNSVTLTTLGSGGAAVNVGSGVMTITDSQVVGNSAYVAGGGLYNSGDGSVLTISRSRVSDNSTHGTGGGIYNAYGGTLAMDHSSLDGNQGYDGGGYYSTQRGDVVIRNSTISGNEASADGGGLWIGGETAAVELSNSTLSNNRANRYAYGAGFGGGMFVEAGAVNLANTIVAGNWNGTSAPIPDDIHGAVTGFYNLIGNGWGMDGLVDGDLGNRVGAASQPVDPRLAPLADNGGTTPTHALLPSSPALDTGDPAFDPLAFSPPLTTDQRGTSFPRVFGSAVDRGAFEDQGGPKLVIQSLYLSPSAIAEGSSVQLAGTFTVDDPQPAYTVTLQWGDGSTSGFELAQDDRSFHANHRYLDNRPGQSYSNFTPQVAITAAKMLDIRSAPVTVYNVAPTIDEVQLPPRIVAGVAAQFSATASDPGQDTLIYYWDFGDGGPVGDEGGDGGGSAIGQSVAHIFDRPGTYFVTLTVYDDDYAIDNRGWDVVVAANSCDQLTASINFETHVAAGGAFGPTSVDPHHLPEQILRVGDTVIPITSYDWGLTHQSSSGGSSTPDSTSFRFSADAGSAASLFALVATTEVLPSLTVTTRREDGTGYLNWTLSDAVVIAYEIRDAEGDYQTPTVTFDLKFSRLEETYLDPVTGAHVASLDLEGFTSSGGALGPVTIDSQAPPEHSLQIGATTIAIASYEWGLTSELSPSGPVALDPTSFRFTADADGAASLFALVATTDILPNAIVTTRQVDGTGYLTWTLSEVLLTSYEITDAEGDFQPPTVTFGLNFSRIEQAYVDPVTAARVASLDLDARTANGGGLGPVVIDPQVPPEHSLQIGATTIPIASFDWGLTHQSNSGGSSTPDSTSFRFSADAGSAASLFALVATTEVLPSLTVTTRREDGTGYLNWTLSDAVVIAYEIRDAEGDYQTPTVTFDLKFSRLEETYLDPVTGAHVASLDLEGFTSSGGALGPVTIDSQAPPEHSLQIGATTIAIASYEWGLTSELSPSGPVALDPTSFRFTADADGAASLFALVATTDILPNAIVTTRQVDGTGYLTWTLSEVLLTSYEITDAEGAYQTPIVRFGLNFGSIESNFQPACLDYPPLAVAGGPYTVAEGTAIVLDGSGSIDDQSIPPQGFEWDLDYDGVTFGADVSGPRPSVTFPDEFPARTIALRVTDVAGQTHIGTSTIAVNDVAPVITTFFAPTTAVVGVAASFSAAATDPGQDLLTFSWDFGDGSAPAIGSSVVHSFADSGTFIVTVTVTDDDVAWDSKQWQVTVNQADLAVVLSAPALAEPGEIVGGVLNLAVSNLGNGDAGPFSVGLYLSLDPMLTTASMLLENGRVNLTGLTSSTSITLGPLNLADVSIPTNTPSGSYYLHAIVDDQYAVEESNEANNSHVWPILIAVKPDLKITAPIGWTSNWHTGQTVGSMLFDWKVENATSTAAGPFHVGAYLSTDATITRGDIPLVNGELPVPGISGNATASLVFPATTAVPQNVTPGTYYFGLIADVNDQVPNPPWGEVSEHNESNNTAFIHPVTVSGPDLTISSFSFGRNAVGPGQQVGDQIHLRIRNPAVAADVAVPFQVRVFLSPDLLVTSADTLLATATVNSLAHSTTLDISFPASAAIPSNFPLGQNFLGAIVDTENTVAEQNELNNSSFIAPVTVTNNTWTILAYLNGDNNLERGILGTLNQLEMVDTANSGITIVALVDRTPGESDVYVPFGGGNWEDTRRGQVAFDGKKVFYFFQYLSTSLIPVLPGELNMGDPKTLSEFLNWGTTFAPAQHYELIIDAHGGRGGFGPDATSANDDMLGREVRTALADAPFIDLLVLDPCEMQTIEFASELIEEVQYVLGSPTVRFYEASGDPLIYHENGLNWLVTHPTASPFNLAQYILASDQVGGWVVPSSHPNRVGQKLVSSLVDIGQLPNLNAKLDEFARLALSSAGILDWNAFRIARDNYTHNYYNSMSLDVGEFFRAVYSVYLSPIAPLNPVFRQAASDVLDAVQDYVVGQKGNMFPGRDGFSIYFPQHAYAIRPDYNGTNHTFLDTKDPHGTHWREFLLHLPLLPDDLKLQPIVITVVVGQGSNLNEAFPTDAVAGQQAFIEGTIASPEQANFFMFEASAGQLLYAVTEGEHIGTLYPAMTVYGPDGQTVIAQIAVTNSADVAEISGLLLPENGSYYVVVSSAGNLDPLHPVAGISSGRYFLHLTFGEAIDVAPRLEVEPAAVNFGNIEPGTPYFESVRLTNTGGTTLTVEDLIFPADVPFRVAEILLPLQLGAGEWIDVPIYAEPTVPGQWSTTLHILSNDPGHPDQAISQVVVSDVDFGDAPAPYPTTLAANGARHLASGPELGYYRDSDVGGQPSLTGTGDDDAGILDDEDGVVLPSAIVAHLQATATVTASPSGQLDAWMDFNRDGDWDDAGEQIAANVFLAAGPHELTFAVPAWATAGTSFARFRLSTAGGLPPIGRADDGEVEDYPIQIVSADPGSAMLVEDPVDPGHSLLIVTGTSENDELVVEPEPSNPLQVRVTNIGQLIGIFASSQINRIAVCGLAGDDTIIVDSRLSRPAEVHGNEGDDSVFSAGSSDALYGDEGNDVITVSDLNFAVVDGDTGVDRLQVAGPESLDLADTGLSTRIRIESLDLANGQPNSLTISPLAVDRISPMNRSIKVWADGQDNVAMDNGWMYAGVQLVADEFVAHFFVGNRHVWLARPDVPWNSPGVSVDVDGNGRTVPLDAILVINALNAHLGGPLLGLPLPDPIRFYDVSGDNFLAPLDAVLVINFLNHSLRTTVEPSRFSVYEVSTGASSKSATNSSLSVTVPQPASVLAPGSAVCLASVRCSTSPKESMAASLNEMEWSLPSDRMRLIALEDVLRELQAGVQDATVQARHRSR